jgi:cell wall-associated NlpC family hydrolase
MDCIGVIVCVARACGIPHSDRLDYPMQPNGELQQELDARFERVTGEPQEGDVLMMQLDRMSEPHHVAILIGGDRIVHAHNRAEKCVVQTYTRFWRQAVRAAYRFPGVE